MKLMSSAASIIALTMGVTLLAAPDFASAADPPALQVTLDTQGLTVTEGGTPIPLNLDPGNTDTSLQEYSGTTTAGEPIADLVYLEPTLPSVTAAPVAYTMESDDVESTDPDVVMPDIEEEVIYDPPDYGPSDQMVPVFGEVATPADVTVAVNLDIVPPKIKGTESTEIQSTLPLPTPRPRCIATVPSWLTSGVIPRSRIQTQLRAKCMSTQW